MMTLCFDRWIGRRIISHAAASLRRAPLATSTLIALLAAGCDRGGDAGPDVGTRTYENPTYHYSFEYPDTLDLREYSHRDVGLGRAAGDGLVVAAEVVIDSGEGEDFESFAIERARQSCAADGPNLAFQCTDVHARHPFTTATGVRGSELYLRHLATPPGSDEILEESLQGPFFVFDASPYVQDAPLAVLFVRPPANLRAGEADVDLITRIAASLDLPPQSELPPDPESPR